MLVRISEMGNMLRVRIRTIRSFRSDAMIESIEDGEWKAKFTTAFISVEVVYLDRYSCKSIGACRSFSSTHEFLDIGYPFHFTRYCFFCFRPVCLSAMISSTSYSSSPSTISGGGCGNDSP